MCKAQLDTAILLVLVRLGLSLDPPTPPRFIVNEVLATAVVEVRSRRMDHRVNCLIGPVPVQDRWGLPVDLLVLIHVQLRMLSVNSVQLDIPHKRGVRLVDTFPWSDGVFFSCLTRH